MKIFCCFLLIFVKFLLILFIFLYCSMFLFLMRKYSYTQLKYHHVTNSIQWYLYDWSWHFSVKKEPKLQQNMMFIKVTQTFKNLMYTLSTFCRSKVRKIVCFLFKYSSFFFIDLAKSMQTKLAIECHSNLFSAIDWMRYIRCCCFC